MARPTFEISPQRLKNLRQGAGLTQLELAKLVHAGIGKKTQPSDATLVSDYQRIERTGRTSRKTALALADVLGITVETLQGQQPPEAPKDFIDQVERQLVSQLESGANHELTRRYERAVEAGDNLADLARELAARIEAAQIGSVQDDLVELSKLTGWSLQQLQKQAYVYGYWFLQTTVLGHNTTQIVLGTNEVLHHVTDTIAKWPRSDFVGCAIRFTKSLPWYYVEFQHPSIPQLTHRFSIVRCQPDTDGVKWRQPTWTDQYWLEDPLRDWAYSSANFVTDFDGERRPLNVRSLRLLVIAADTRKAFKRKRAFVAVALDDFLEDVLQRHREYGEEHSFMTNWLLNELWTGIAPHLMACPFDGWTVTSSEGAVEFAMNYRVPYELMKQRLAFPDFLPDRFGIALVEEHADHAYRRAPWSRASIETFTAELTKRLAQGFEQVDAAQALAFEEMFEPGERVA